MSTDQTSDTSSIATENAGRFHLGTQPTSFPSSGSQVQTAAPDLALEFRVARDGALPRRLKLTGARYTFGNAEGCSIRLSDPALRPMHAVLLHDRTSVTLRGYSEPIEVNGAFELETRLSVGDVFRLGQYEFSLIDRQVPKPLSRDASFKSKATDDLNDASRFVGRPAPSVVTESASLPPVEESLWRKRLHEEVDQWRQRQKECQVREDELRVRESDLWRRAQELQDRDDTIRNREVSLRSRESQLKEVQEASSHSQSEIAQLRDRANRQHETLKQREEELNTRRALMEQQESLFQSKLDDAARQLMHSQHQADAATASVARLREQFDSLNRQVDELTAQQTELESREQNSIQRQEEILVDLERYRQRVTEAEDARTTALSDRDRAESARQEGEAARQEAEKAKKAAEQIAHIKSRDAELAAERLDELSRQVADLRDQAIAEAARKDVRLRESRDEIDHLREQIDELQDTVETARRESIELRQRCEAAEAKVRQLETVASENEEFGRRLADTDQLRSAMDHLSLELARANEELAKVRSDNDSLSAELDDLRQQRDEAIASRADLESKLEQSVSREQYDSLKAELDSTVQQLQKASDDSVGIQLSPSNHGDSWSDNDALPALSVVRAFEPEPLQEDSDLELRTEDQDAPVQDDISASLDRTSMWHSDEETESEIPQSSWGNDVAPQSSAETSPSDESCELNQSVWLPTVERSEPMPVSDASQAWNLAVTPDEDTSESDNPWPTYEEPSQGQFDAASSHHPMQIEERYEEFAENVDADLPSPSQWFDSTAVDVSNPDPESIASDEVPASDGEHWATRMWQQSDSDSPDEDIAVSQHAEMTSPWSLQSPIDEHFDDEANDRTQCANAFGPSVDVQSTPQESSHVENEIAEGSIASRLLREIESAELSKRRREEQEFDTSEDGTYLMPTSQPVVDHQAPSKDLEDSSEPDEDSTTYIHSASNEYSYSEHSIGEAFSDSAEPIDQLSSDDEVSSVSREHEVEEQEVEEQAEESRTPVSEPAAEAEDDSIEAYMNRLLGRVQGRSGQESAPAASVSMSTVTKSRPTLTPVEETKTGEDVAQSTSAASNEPIVPRSQAPEKNSDLSAMRQLANDSARSAISASVEKRSIQIRKQALIHFMVAGACVLMGGMATTIVKAPILYVSWLMAAVATAVSIKQGISLWNESRERSE